MSLKTRQRIQALAKEHGFRANPLVSAQMSAVKNGRKTISWEATIGFAAHKSLDEAVDEAKTALKFYYDGAAKRASELGFKLKFVTLRPEAEGNLKLEESLSRHAVKGVIFAPSGIAYPLSNFEFNWSDYAVVSLANIFKNPRINSICNDEFETINRALTRFEEAGFKRIGIAMRESQDMRVKHVWLAGFEAYQARVPRSRRIRKLMTQDWSKENFIDWFEAERPDMILCIDDDPMRWLGEEGVMVPRDVKLATLYWLPSRPQLAGYYQNHEVMGAAAVDLVSAQLYHNERGLPLEPKKVLIQSIWRDGESFAAD